MKISAVIPTFNRASLIEGAIHSVLRQTVPVSELIIVDDGSTDCTEDLVRRLSISDQRIIFIKQQRGGANRARNAGSKAATGDWIAFLDSDDTWEKDKLRLQLAALAENPGAVASFTGLRNIGVNTEKIYLPPFDPSLFEIRSANVLSTTSTAMINKTVFWEVGGFDPELPSCQDWDLWFRLRQKGHFAVVRQPLVRYNSGPHERITSNFGRVIDGHEQVFRRLRAGIEHDRQASRRISAKHKLVLTEVYLRSGDPKTAVRQCMSSLLTSPSKRGVRLLATSARHLVTGLLHQ
ncbi:glycosyltransferase family 2 protein [Microvirga arabica]|uniref:glycosyltransferase family 2 protein n=1 Tax=Microvirga arabica TaxID=1128671 RepID=UPI001939995E|nr:glycosyltransferase family 2 protein [Microvirga arabica]